MGSNPIGGLSRMDPNPTHGSKPHWWLIPTDGSLLVFYRNPAVVQCPFPTERRKSSFSTRALDILVLPQKTENSQRVTDSFPMVQVGVIIFEAPGIGTARRIATMNLMSWCYLLPVNKTARPSG